MFEFLINNHVNPPSAKGTDSALLEEYKKELKNMSDSFSSSDTRREAYSPEIEVNVLKYLLFRSIYRVIENNEETKNLSKEALQVLFPTTLLNVSTKEEVLTVVKSLYENKNKNYYGSFGHSWSVADVLGSINSAAKVGAITIELIELALTDRDSIV